MVRVRVLHVRARLRDAKRSVLVEPLCAMIGAVLSSTLAWVLAIRAIFGPGALTFGVVVLVFALVWVFAGDDDERKESWSQSHGDCDQDSGSS